MATNYARASFQEIYDFNTKPGSATIVGVHTPISTRVHEYLHGFFEQFRKFKYSGCSMVVVPVSQLPVDPLQVSYEAGDPGVDPRDIVNPILHRGIHGESLGNYLESIFNVNLDKSIFDGLDVVDYDPETYPESALTMDSMYYSALSSPAWKKAHVQKGFRKAGLHPMYYSLGSNRQIMPHFDDYTGLGAPGIQLEEEGADLSWQVSTYPDGFVDPSLGQAYETDELPVVADTQVLNSVNGNISRNEYVVDSPQFFTGKLTRLGWLDTLQNAVEYSSVDGNLQTVSDWTALPKLYMYMMMLPPCYKQRLHFRVVLTHYYEFRGFRSMKTPGSFISYTAQSYNGITGSMIPLEGPTIPIVGGTSPMSTRSAQDTLTLVGVEGELVTDGVS